MSISSGEIDLNTDAVSFDRENEVLRFNPSEPSVSVSVSEAQTLTGSMNDEVRIQDQNSCLVGHDQEANGSVEPISGSVVGCDVMINASGKEAFDEGAEFGNRANDVKEAVELVDLGSDTKASYFEDRVNDAKVAYFLNVLAKDEDKKSTIACSDVTKVVHGGMGTERDLVVELNGCVESELKYENATEATDNSSTGIKVECNKEARGGDNLVECTKEDGNPEACFHCEGGGRGLDAEIAKEGADILANSGTVDADKITAADNMISKHSLQDSHLSGIIEPTCQLRDVIPDMEVKSVDVKASLHHKEPVSGNYLFELETSQGLKDQILEVDGLAKATQSGTIGINFAEAGPFGNVQNKRNFNLVVDLNPQRNLLEVDIDIKPKSLEFNFSVSDLVWGKVRGHPWWPGQIFDPSSASEMAKRHFKRDFDLIAYFGDQTYSWNEASMIKPFHMHFSQMVKQSNLENFHHAVDRTLDEVSRRVEFGLSCPCLPEEVLTKLKTQIITNAGIQKQWSRRDRGDRILNATSFEPKKLVNFVKSLAPSPLSETGRLDFIISRAQLSAFYRSKGYSPMGEFIVLDGILENDTEFLYNGEKKQYDDHIDGRELKTQPSFSHKRKHISGVSLKPSKKQRSLSELMSENCLYIPKCKHRKSSSQSVSHSSSRKRKAAQDSSDDYSCESQHRKFIRLENVYPDELFLQLCLAAADPMRESHLLSDMVHFFTEFRYVVIQDDSITSVVDSRKDSHWIDRIIQSIDKEQLLFKNQNEREELLPKTPTQRLEETAESSVSLDFSQQEADGNLEFEPSKLETHSDESLTEEICSTALILKFTSMDTVPSEANLKQIFGRFGPLIESKTKLLKKKNRAIVVFKRYSDAQTAFSGAGKYDIFGSSLESYRLKTMNPTSEKATSGARKQRLNSSCGRH
ncbi:hypothetical protein L6164_009820 [Bauhinia variegata]|uniref:Uncharacterized protein n=1 Tax=Bauhinia variegata TaxID=167791 RepID=A0ACB9PKB3_BAUVA|nr:hypothetical protein L6164_009820 [Bauhinia variegata]